MTWTLQSLNLRRLADFRNDVVQGVGGKQILLEDPSRGRRLVELAVDGVTDPTELRRLTLEGLPLSPPH